MLLEFVSIAFGGPFFEWSTCHRTIFLHLLPRTSQTCAPSSDNQHSFGIHLKDSAAKRKTPVRKPANYVGDDQSAKMHANRQLRPARLLHAIGDSCTTSDKELWLITKTRTGFPSFLIPILYSAPIYPLFRTTWHYLIFYMHAASGLYSEA